MPKAVAYDADAQAFITATGISGTNASAINTLVIDLKAANIWTKMKALYPIIGGTATSHKFNLKDSRDLDAAFRLVFSGGVTHSTNGVLFNGVNGFANTFLNMSTQYSNAYDVHLSANIYTDFVGILAQGHIGANISSSQVNRLGATSSISEHSFLGTNSNNIAVTVTSTTHKGFWCGSRLLFNLHNFISPTGAISTNTTAIASSLPNITIGLGCRRSATNDFFSAFGYSFFSAGVGLTTIEMTNFKTAVNNFNTTLGRI